MRLEDVDRIAVLGAGTMGHGIAAVAALAGYDVTMRDVEAELVRDGYDRIERSFDSLVGSGRIDEGDAAAALDRIDPLVDMAAAVDDADVVVEAVPERMAVKTDVYGDLERLAPDRAAFATNTSSLPITDLAAATDRPERFCGMHFFNPPLRMDLVEVVPGDHTDEGTVDLIAGLAESMGRTPVRVRNDSPGFVVNRILLPLVNEAAWIVESGEATVGTVDSTATDRIGLPMGPFELADHVGIDVAYHVLEFLADELGAAYQPCPLLAETVERDELGKKTGEGFYEYGEARAGAEAAAADGRVDEAVRRRLLAVMANEVAGLIADDVADRETIDRAVVLGAGFPKGPSELADDAGLDPLCDTLDGLAAATGAERYRARAELRAAAAAGGFHARGDGKEDGGIADGKGDGGIADGPDGGGVADGGNPPGYDTLAVDVRDAVGHVEIDRPDRMNTITETVLDELEAAIDRLDADDRVRSVLLTGAGDRAFSAGADLRQMADVDPIDGVELSRRGQRVFGKLEAADAPVVAGIDGYCLGGGMELATCADLRIASERSELGQPEHDLGLLPGWGGTGRLARIVGEGRAKEIVLTADRYDPETLADYGFLNEVVGADAFADRVWRLATELAAGPPIAQAYTKRAIHAGRDDEAAGLEVESQAFGHLLGTEDFAEGVAAFVDDEHPEFSGE